MKGKIYRTDLFIYFFFCGHSRQGKTWSYSQIKTVHQFVKMDESTWYNTCSQNRRSSAKI